MTLPEFTFWLLSTPALAAASLSEYMKPSLIGPLVLAAGAPAPGAADPTGAVPAVVLVVVPGTTPDGELPPVCTAPGGALTEVGATVGADNEEPSGPTTDPAVGRTVVPHPATAT